MKTPLLASVLSVALAVGPAAIETPRPAFACSAPADFDPVASSEVIVSGRITGWEPVTVRDRLPTFQPVRVTMDVEAVLHGPSAPSRLSFIDTASLLSDVPGRWAGASGACGAFNEDPTGKYVILGLNRDDDGSLRSHAMLVLLFGDRAGALDAPPYNELRRLLTNTQMDGYNFLPRPPAEGIAPPSTGSAGLIAATLKE